MAKAKAVPEGYSTVTPSLIQRDCTKAIDYYKKALGAVIEGAVAQPAPVGANGTTAGGPSPDGSKAVTVVMFTEGRTFVTLKFDAAMTDAVAPPLASQVAQRQDALIKTARMQRLSLPAEIWHIRLPAAAPHLFSGLKLAVTYSFIGVIAGEFILSTSGLGHQIAFSYDNFDNRTMYGVILFVLCIATAFNLLVFAYERRLARQRGA